MRKRIFALLVVLMSLAVPVLAAERHMMHPRVPADKLAEARALTSPLPASPEIVEKGKVVYSGKGTCFNCHGIDGDGKGPAAAGLDPSPRNFQHHGFWRHRTEGELFWVIKHGSPGTAMIGFGQVLSDDEIWAVVRYLYSFASERGRGRMGHGRGMGMMGHDGMGGMGHSGPKGGTSGCEDNGCGQ
ncbi:MAG TPA: cytochrome c [Nitrospira sp.]|nr:cytochrome c [Nitrospira sp.]